LEGFRFYPSDLDIDDYDSLEGQSRVLQFPNDPVHLNQDYGYLGQAYCESIQMRANYSRLNTGHVAVTSVEYSPNEQNVCKVDEITLGYYVDEESPCPECDRCEVQSTTVTFAGPDRFGNEVGSGTLVDDIFPGFSISDTTPDGRIGVGMIFDTSNPNEVSREDPDLIIPELGNLLIISENGNTDYPDDNAAGGTITITFDCLVTMESITIVDVEKYGGLIESFDSNGNLIQEVEIPRIGNKEWEEIPILEVDRHDEVLIVNVTLPGSGAIAEFKARMCPFHLCHYLDTEKFTLDPDGSEPVQLSPPGTDTDPRNVVFVEYCFQKITTSPSATPTQCPTVDPSVSPSSCPSISPSSSPSTSPSTTPSFSPTHTPSKTPSCTPSVSPTNSPSLCPSVSPSISPSLVPSKSPSAAPSLCPSTSPSSSPSCTPSEVPSSSPSAGPSFSPSLSPSLSPSVAPSSSPSKSPTLRPTHSPLNGESPQCRNGFRFYSTDVESDFSENGDGTLDLFFGYPESPNIANTPSHVVGEYAYIDLLDDCKFQMTATVGVASNGHDGIIKIELMAPPDDIICDIIRVSLFYYQSASDNSGSSLYLQDEESGDSEDGGNDIGENSEDDGDSNHDRNPDSNPSIMRSMDFTYSPGEVSSGNKTFEVVRRDQDGRNYAIAFMEVCFEEITSSPSLQPSISPSMSPSVSPSDSPSLNPSISPSLCPSVSPSVSPTNDPTASPTKDPSQSPSLAPSVAPSSSPTREPSEYPSSSPTCSPSSAPSFTPTCSPSETPSVSPSSSPSFSPSDAPSEFPSSTPSDSPTCSPSRTPSVAPTVRPTHSPHDSFTPGDDCSNGFAFYAHDQGNFESYGSHDSIITYSFGTLGARDDAIIHTSDEGYINDENLNCSFEMEAFIGIVDNDWMGIYAVGIPEPIGINDCKINKMEILYYTNDESYCNDCELCGREDIRHDFDGQDKYGNDVVAGMLVGNNFPGFRVSTQRDNRGTFEGMIFDTRNETGGDSDLTKHRELGNIIIISEDGDSTNPDDNSAGGVIEFTFYCSSEIFDMTLVDIDTDGTKIDLFSENGRLIKSVNVDNLGDGSKQIVPLYTQDVKILRVILSGSGGVADFEANMCPADTCTVSHYLATEIFTDLDISPLSPPGEVRRNVVAATVCFEELTSSPTLSPSQAPSTFPSLSPSSCPTATPSLSPSVAPTVSPSLSPSCTPSLTPSSSPSSSPSLTPSFFPSYSPSESPSRGPSLSPSSAPSKSPSSAPSQTPSLSPSVAPTSAPSTTPSLSPSSAPSTSPSASPSVAPSTSPSFNPSMSPSESPTFRPTYSPVDAQTPGADCRNGVRWYPDHEEISEEDSNEIFFTIEAGEDTDIKIDDLYFGELSYVESNNCSISFDAFKYNLDERNELAAIKIKPIESDVVCQVAQVRIQTDEESDDGSNVVREVIEVYSIDYTYLKMLPVRPTARLGYVEFCMVEYTSSPTSATPTTTPTTCPSTSPTVCPTKSPSYSPSVSPSLEPTLSPSETPSEAPSPLPSCAPSVSPSETPSISPSSSPSESPSGAPTVTPTEAPSLDFGRSGCVFEMEGGALNTAETPIKLLPEGEVELAVDVAPDEQSLGIVFGVFAENLWVSSPGQHIETQLLSIGDGDTSAQFCLQLQNPTDSEDAFTLSICYALFTNDISSFRFLIDGVQQRANSVTFLNVEFPITYAITREDQGFRFSMKSSNLDSHILSTFYSTSANSVRIGYALTPRASTFAGNRLAEGTFSSNLCYLTESPSMAPSSSPITFAPLPGGATYSPQTKSPTETSNPTIEFFSKSPTQTTSPSTYEPTGIGETRRPTTSAPVTRQPLAQDETFAPTISPTISPSLSPRTRSPSKVFSPTSKSPVTKAPLAAGETHTPSLSPTSSSPSTSSPSLTLGCVKALIPADDDLLFGDARAYPEGLNISSAFGALTTGDLAIVGGDRLVMVYQEGFSILDGDSISVKIQKSDHVSGSSCLMVRADIETDVGERPYFAVCYGTTTIMGRVQVQYRQQEGGNAILESFYNAVPPLTLRISKNGDFFSGFVTYFTEDEVQLTSQPIDMSNISSNAIVGYAMASSSMLTTVWDGSLCGIIPRTIAPTTHHPTLTPTTLSPTSSPSVDIEDCMLANIGGAEGEFVGFSNSLQIFGVAGRGIEAEGDGIAFAYRNQKWRGNALTAQVEFSEGGLVAQACLVVRAGLGETDDTAAVCLVHDGGSSWYPFALSRINMVEESSAPDGTVTQSFPVALKLEMIENDLVASKQLSDETEFEILHIFTDFPYLPGTWHFGYSYSGGYDPLSLRNVLLTDTSVTFDGKLCGIGVEDTIAPTQTPLSAHPTCHLMEQTNFIYSGGNFLAPEDRQENPKYRLYDTPVGASFTFTGITSWSNTLGVRENIIQVCSDEDSD